MKIESKAIIRRRIRNIKADIKSCRNSGNTLRMRVLYAQLTSDTIKLQNMTHQHKNYWSHLRVMFNMNTMRSLIRYLQNLGWQNHKVVSLIKR